MSRKRFSAEQIIPKLREAEVEIARGATVAAAAKKIGVNEQTFYRWWRFLAGSGRIFVTPTSARMTARAPRPKRPWLLLAIMIAWAVVDATTRRNKCCPRPVDCLLAPAIEK